MKKIVINYYGAPGSGKTVAASSIFARLKKDHHDVGLVTEYARQAVVEQNKLALEDQLFVWANQQHHIFCASKHYDIVVTDSPILLGAIYNTNSSKQLKNVIFDEYHKYTNVNVMLKLSTEYPYSMAGRVHSFTESMSIENQLVDLLTDNNIPFIYGDDISEDDVIELLSEVE